jgi:hypothetical protein
MGAATQGLSSIAGAIGSGSKYNFTLPSTLPTAGGRINSIGGVD